MSNASDTLEHDYRVLELIERQPDISQRELAKELGVSLGKTNYVLSALIERGVVKAENFKKSNNKAGYLYLLTPVGINEKSKIAKRFLDRKLKEYDDLTTQIAELKRDMSED